MEDAWKNDLSERFDPMTVKELRQCMRRASFIYPYLIIHLLALGAMIAEFQNGYTSEFSKYAGMLNVELLFTSGPLWMVAAIICMLVMPMSGIVLMGQELEEGNHELLQMATLNRWKIVIGKFCTLWGLCMLTLISLLPYVVVRYWVGGIEWWHELACGTTVAGGSALLSAGAIGASAFRRPVARAGVFLLFFASMAGGCGIPLIVSAMMTGGCGWLYHLTALAAVGSYLIVGLALARSRLRLAIHAFEVNPSGMFIGLMVASPFAIGLITAVTGGWAGFLGLVGLALVARVLDVTPQLQIAKPPPFPAAPPQEASGAD